VMLCLLASGVSANVLSITPASAQHQTGETQSYDVILDSAPQALSGFDITIAIENSAVGEITGVSFPAWANPKSNGTVPSSVVWCKAIDLANQSGMQNIVLCTITVRAIGTGTTNINFTSVKVEDTVGGKYDPSLVPSVLTVGGDDISEVGVFRGGVFYRNGATDIVYGLPTDTPVVGNWNGYGISEVGVFREGVFYRKDATDIVYGLPTDTPVIGDWNGDGISEVGVFRDGVFYRNGATDIVYGLPTDTPVIGDWNGDLKSEVGVYRGGVFYRNGADAIVYGLSTDTPVIGDWNGDGMSEVGVYRDGVFYRNGATDIVYGIATDTPVIGKWT